MGHTRTCLFRLAAFGACLLVLVISWSCGGGGSSGGGPAAEGVYGKVGVLITDAPSNEYDHIWVTITEISLLAEDCEASRTCREDRHDRDRECCEECCDGDEGECGDDCCRCCCGDGCCPDGCADGGEEDGCDDDDECDDGDRDGCCGGSGDDCDGKVVTIFSSDEGYTLDLLQYRDDDFLLLINEEVPAGTYRKIRMRISEIRAEGGPCEDMEIKLPSGRIDLNPRSPFTIGENELIYLRLDIDVNKSIHLHSTGSGKCIFRPVVFVDVLTSDDVPRCPVVIRGEVKQLHDESGDWIPESLTLKREGNTAGSCLGDMRVCFADDVLVFTEAGAFGSPADLEAGQSITVVGMTRAGCFAASLILIGDCRTIKGVIQEVSGCSGFLLDPYPCEGTESPVKVVLADETTLLAGCGTPIDSDALEAGMRVLVIGRFDDGCGTLTAAVVFVQADEIEGTIAGMECGKDGYVFLIDTGEGHAVEVFVPEGAHIALEGDGLVPDAMIPLLACHPYHIRIVQGYGGAKKVLITPEPITGAVENIYPYSRTIQVGGYSVQVQTLATGVYISEKGDALVSLDVLEQGDRVTCFGLKACGDLEQFHAFVFLVEE